MTEIIKETVSTESSQNGAEASVVKPTKIAATNSQTAEYLIYFFFGALEILLAFRLVLKVMGASVSSAFVSGMYGITGLFILPFEGIFHKGFNQGLETTSVIEPATIVALVVYATLAWGIVKLTRIFSGERQA